MTKQTYKIAILPGDGIGPEVTREAIKVLHAIEKISDLAFELEETPIGGAAYDQTGKPLPETTLKLAKDADAILLGAVGGPQWEHLDYSVRPERALLGIRKELGLFANLRPALVFDELIDASSLKSEIIQGVDLLVVRELTGGIYFGTPRGVSEENGQKVGRNTYIYSENEIERIAHVAFQAAQVRKQKICSVDKANVLETTELWRETVSKIHKNYPDIELSHMYVDNAAMQLIKNPKQFDVIVTGNLFGDILSDEAAMLTGSIGMLPSASLNSRKKGLYEPVHGSAPDIAGKNIANPIATILSVAMMLIHSFQAKVLGTFIEKAVKKVLKNGYRTADIYSKGMKKLGTSEMGNKIVEEILSSVC